MNDPLDVAATEERHTQQADARREAALQAENDFKWVMSDARGRAFIWRELEASGIYRASMAGDFGLTAFNEGRRDRGLKLLAQVNRLTPDEYFLMQKENLRAHS